MSIRMCANLGVRFRGWTPRKRTAGTVCDASACILERSPWTVTPPCRDDLRYLVQPLGECTIPGWHPIGLRQPRGSFNSTWHRRFGRMPCLVRWKSHALLQPLRACWPRQKAKL
jgi:hypothetical protein